MILNANQPFPNLIRGIIFDFDGVVVDSEKHWATVENPYLRQHIDDWQDDDYNLLLGKSLSEVHEFLAEERGFGLSAEQYFADYERMAVELYAHVARPLQGLVALLDSLREARIPCAIASSSKRSWIDSALEANGLGGYFPIIVSAHDAEVEKGKPAPDVYLRAAQLLHLPVTDVLAIEDSRNGVASARAASIYCVGLRTDDNPSQDLSAADIELSSYNDLIKLVAKIDQARPEVQTTKSFRDITEHRNAAAFINTLDKESLVVYSPTSLANVAHSNTKVHMIDCRIFERNIAFMDSLSLTHKSYKQLVSLGGGVATDVAKYLAYRMGATFTSIPSMLSTNAFATDKVALVVGDEKVTLDAKLPDAIIYDDGLMQKAEIQNLYGLADVLSIHTALHDWRLAKHDISEAINQPVYDAANMLLQQVQDFVLSTDFSAVAQDIAKLYAYIGESGHITNLHGTGRPESGSEHIFAKKLESLIDMPHGVSVSLGIILMAIIQNNHPAEVAGAIRKIGTLDKLQDYAISETVIRQAFAILKPRADRYSVINTVEFDDALVDSVLQTFKQLTGIELAS